MNNYIPATQPTIYFIGVTTGSSSIMKVFPKWAKALHLDDAVIKGMDFQPHSDPESYREAVTFIKDDQEYPEQGVRQGRGCQNAFRVLPLCGAGIRDRHGMPGLRRQGLQRV